MEYILTKEEFENFVGFAFKSLKYNNLFNFYSRNKIKNLFVNPNLNFVSKRKSNVKLGSRNIFIDFPREIYEMMQYIYDICDGNAADLPKNARGEEELIEYKKFVETIRVEKNDPEKRLGKLSKLLLDIGIKWNTIFVPYYRKPVVKYEVEGYYRKFWKNKVLQFIGELQKGDNSLVSIYEKIQALTAEYGRLEKGKEHRVPHIINLILGKNDYLSIEKELEKLENLFVKAGRYAKENWGEHSAYLQFELVLMDIKTIIYQIRYGLKSGYCFTPFLLLRKLIVSWGFFLFQDTFLQHYWEEIDKISFPVDKSEDSYWEIVEKWVNRFKKCSGWNKLSFFGDYVALNPLKKRDESTIRVLNVNTFKNTIKNKGRGYYFIENPNVDLRDRFLVEQLDVIRNYKMDVYSFAKLDKKLLDEDKKLYDEYQKLSGIVHEPICIDYPPFGSFLEYLAFLYHLRKILYLLQETFNFYKK
jgi:hypothetical protein